MRLIPEKFRALHERVSRGEASPRQAIKAKCQECVGFETAVQRVSECAIKKCPLWSYRPYQKLQTTEGEGSEDLKGNEIDSDDSDLV